VFFVGIAPALVTLWIRRDVPEPELWRRERKQNTPVKWRPILPALFALLLMNTGGMFAWWGLFTWMPAYLALPVAEGGRGFPMSNVTSFLVILNLVGMLPGYLVFGQLADRFGRKRTIVGYLIAAAIMAVAFSAARSPGMILAAASATAFFGTGFFTGSGIIGSEVFPTAIRASALGISYNAARGLSALAPMVIGSIGQTRGLDAAFYTCGAAFAVAALFALFVPETRGRELS
jgi:MFS family permease